MTRRPSNLPLWIGFAASILLHGLLLLPLLLRTMTAAGSPITRTARFDPQDVQPPTPADEPKIDLGIDDGTPSTLTWLGYREYETHQAPPSEVEQAAFTDDPSTPAPLTPPMPTEQQTADSAESPSQQNAPEPATADATDAAQQSPADAEMSATEPAANQTVASAPATNDEQSPPREVATSPNVSPAESMLALAEALRRLLETASGAPTIDALSESAADADPAEPTDASASPSPATPPAGPPATEPAADQADRDADPSSVVDVPLDEIRLGKPLAARGLTLHPQKPSFTTLTLMTAAPRNPLVEIDFLRTGRVIDARIVESSQDARVDRAIEASLFRWLAEGKQLDALADDARITIRIRVILSRRPE